MSVKITVKGNQEAPEYRDATQLMEIFEKGFQNSNATGEVLISSNVTLYGQEVKDVDIVVLGNLNNFNLTFKTSSKTRKDKEDLPEDKRPVNIRNFCFVIETKSHDAGGIRIDGDVLKVKYNHGYHDVTYQSERQKYSLKKYLENEGIYAPRICNFIWLTNVSANTIKELTGGRRNLLPTDFSLRWLFQLACLQEMPYCKLIRGTESFEEFSEFSCLRGKADLRQLESVFDLFTKIKNGIGDLTRKKIERITKGLLKDQKYAQAIGEKLVIISGRAGTGKTMKLLTIAFDLAEQQDARSLILTYNKALVGDIRRTIALADVPDGIDSYTISISTLHAFFGEILIGFGIVKDNKKSYIPDYFNRYEGLIAELHSYFIEEVIDAKDLDELMKSRNQQIAWDYVLVDEAQDWSEIERDVLYFIFGKEKVIVADGVDQMVRSQKKCNWLKGIPKNDYIKTNEKKGLRQKISLVNFVNDNARGLGINWNIEPDNNFYGGRIIIKIGEYTQELHEEEFGLCKQSGNSAYEMMFLTPPSLVNKSIGGFKKSNDFQALGIHIWDGTLQDNKSIYPTNIDQHRLYQYDSCRGLEAWTVVCLEFDEFLKYKSETYEEVDTGELALESFEDKRNRFVGLWALIPLTRAIDTLIITIKDVKSPIHSLLKKLHDANPDSIQWYEQERSSC